MPNIQVAGTHGVHLACILTPIYILSPISFCGIHGTSRYFLSKHKTYQHYVTLLSLYESRRITILQHWYFKSCHHHNFREGRHCNFCEMLMLSEQAFFLCHLVEYSTHRQKKSNASLFNINHIPEHMGLEFHFL